MPWFMRVPTVRLDRNRTQYAPHDAGTRQVGTGVSSVRLVRLACSFWAPGAQKPGNGGHWRDSDFSRGLEQLEGPEGGLGLVVGPADLRPRGDEADGAQDTSKEQG